jgi:hypothetical protein
VLGSAGVLAILAGWLGRRGRVRRGLRLAGGAGAVAFLLAAAESALGGRAFLELPPGHAGAVILAMEVAVTTPSRCAGRPLHREQRSAGAHWGR